MSIVIAADGEAYWSKPVDLGFMGKFDEIIIDLDRCEAAGVIEGMSQRDILDKATAYYEDRFKNLEADAGKIGEQPVLNFEKLIATIHPDLLNTSDEYISFQVSSEVCGGMLLCATYGIIYENNELEVTNNC